MAAGLGDLLEKGRVRTGGTGSGFALVLKDSCCESSLTVAGELDRLTFDCAATLGLMAVAVVAGAFFLPPIVARMADFLTGGGVGSFSSESVSIASGVLRSASSKASDSSEDSSDSSAAASAFLFEARVVVLRASGTLKADLACATESAEGQVSTSE